MQFTSVESCEEILRQNDVEQLTRQLGKGPFRSLLAVRSMRQADLFADRYNTGLSLHLQPPKGTVSFLFPRSANGKFLCNGKEVGNSSIIVFSSGSSLDIVTSALAGSEAFSIPETRYHEIIETLSRVSKPTILENPYVIREADTQLQALRKILLELIAHPDVDPNPECLSNVLAATVAWLQSTSGFDCQDHIKCPGARSRIAKLAQEYIEEHYHEAVSTEDLCRVTCASARSLQRCFREYFDLTPTAYLKMVRLNTAHRELASAHPSEASITRIAIRNGFTHFGRFSIAFRERFRESPSKTLRNRLIKRHNV